MLVVSIIFCLVAGSTAVFVEPGPCPKVTVNKMNLTEMSGIWFKTASTENEYDHGQSSVTLDWLLPINDVSTFSATSISKNSGDVLKTEGKFTINQTTNQLKGNFSLPILGIVEKTFSNVALNLNSYSVSWACENQGPNHIKAIAFYTREQNPPKEVLLEAQQESEKNGVVLSGLIKYD